MIKKIDKKNKLYFVTSADWEGIVECRSCSEAANTATEGALKKFGKKTKLAPGIVVLSLTEYAKYGSADSATHIFYTPTVLADIGLHSLSKKVDVLMGKLTNSSESWEGEGGEDIDFNFDENVDLDDNY